MPIISTTWQPTASLNAVKASEATDTFRQVATVFNMAKQSFFNLLRDLFRSSEVESEIERQLQDNEGNNLWPEFRRFLFESTSNGTTKLKLSALKIFGSVPGISGNQQSQYINVIKQMFQQCMSGKENYPIRFQAVKSLSSFILLHDDNVGLQKNFQVF